MSKLPHYLSMGKIKYEYILKYDQCKDIYIKENVRSKTKSPSSSNIIWRKSKFDPDHIKDSAFIARKINKSPVTVGHF